MARGGQRDRTAAKVVSWSTSVVGRLAERRRAAIEEHGGAHAARPEPALDALVDPAPEPRPAPSAAPPLDAASPLDAAPRPVPPPREAGPHEPPRHRDPHPGRPATPAEAVPWGLRVAAESTWRLLLLGAALYVIFYVVDMLRLVAFALLAGVLISALLEPTVSWLKRHGVPRSLAATGTFLAGLVGIGLVGWFVVWQVTTNISEVSNQATNGVQTMHNWLLKGPMHLTDKQLNDFTTQATKAIASNTQQITSLGFTTAGIVIEVVTGVLLGAFTTYFLLYDGAKIWSWVLRGLPQQSRYAMAGAGPKAWATLTAYVRGTVFVAFIDALCIGIGIQLLGVPLAMPLAVIIFLGAFVPLVGALVTGTLAVLIALVTSHSLYTPLMVLVVLIAVQQIEGHLLQPLILGRAVRVHPLGVVLGVAAGSIIGGIGGAIVAVPLIAVTNTVVGHLRRRNAAADEVFVALEAAQDAAAAQSAQKLTDPSPEQPVSS
ncbi:AI-2E family transporter [Kitasatospora sp. NBC_01287]|uniref:AI-2E family transporter n=1 Tax=Kitasatospora sp. NBC_01287 TaxID=2903573 RepID=UPI00224CBE76|nr:AI-2E family transporter [Kitasatospora sp. NBC_01287]MCX4747014.1 AI-2E family transporter [Kitasatospora sp. NBC_01287]